MRHGYGTVYTAARSMYNTRLDVLDWITAIIGGVCTVSGGRSLLYTVVVGN